MKVVHFTAAPVFREYDLLIEERSNPSGRRVTRSCLQTEIDEHQAVSGLRRLHDDGVCVMDDP